MFRTLPIAIAGLGTLLPLAAMAQTYVPLQYNYPNRGYMRPTTANAPLYPAASAAPAYAAPVTSYPSAPALAPQTPAQPYVAPAAEPAPVYEAPVVAPVAAAPPPPPPATMAEQEYAQAEPVATSNAVPTPMASRKFPKPSWYFGISGSANFVNDADISLNTTPRTTGVLDFDAGYGVAATLGYRNNTSGGFSDHLRYELELSVRDNEFGDAMIGGVNTVGTADIQVGAVMANLYVDMFSGAGWRPYVGGGVGVGRAFMDTLGVDDEVDTKFAYQGMAGVFYTPESFQAAEFGVGYRYFAMQDPEFATTSANTLKMDYSSHSVEANTRFFF